MTIMRYNLFKQIFNEAIFEKSKVDLLEKIASSPSRYIGLFRPTKPKAKILQNLLQSHEIRFGDAFERVIEEYFRLKGCEILPKRFTNREGDVLNIDQCFRKDRKIYFTLYSAFRVMHQDIIYECFIWAFLLRSRRATGYAIASVLDAPCVQARMPFACLTQFYAWGCPKTRVIF